MRSGWKLNRNPSYKSASIYMLWLAAAFTLFVCHPAATAQAIESGFDGALLLVQVHAKKRQDPAGNMNTPRMFVSQGCDGSTAIMNHAYHILNLHGINAGDPRIQKEVLDPPRNKFIDEGNKDIFVAMKRLRDERTKWGNALVFKGIVIRDDAVILNRRLVDMGTLAVLNSRRNMLDEVVCMVRDCFVDTDERTTTYGYPVDENGNWSQLCFERRETDANEDYKAKLIVSELADNIRWFEYQVVGMLRRLQVAGYNASRVYYEDLIAFESEARNIPTSMEAWNSLLSSWGVVPSPSLLRSYLREGAGKGYMPVSHSDVIYNFEEVKAELEKSGKLDLLRF